MRTTQDLAWSPLVPQEVEGLKDQSSIFARTACIGLIALLSGGVGHDQLAGGDDRDPLQGDTGNDTLIGGGGEVADLQVASQNDGVLKDLRLVCGMS